MNCLPHSFLLDIEEIYFTQNFLILFTILPYLTKHSI